MNKIFGREVTERRTGNVMDMNLVKFTDMRDVEKINSRMSQTLSYSRDEWEI